jgi:hypothetical protein
MVGKESLTKIGRGKVTDGQESQMSRNTSRQQTEADGRLCSTPL